MTVRSCEALGRVRRRGSRAPRARARRAAARARPRSPSARPARGRSRARPRGRAPRRRRRSARSQRLLLAHRDLERRALERARAGHHLVASARRPRRRRPPASRGSPRDCSGAMYAGVPVTSSRSPRAARPRRRSRRSRRGRRARSARCRGLMSRWIDAGARAPRRAPAHLARDRDRLGAPERAVAREPRAQRLALDQLHRAEHDVAGAPELERARDVAVRDAPRELDLAAEPLERVRRRARGPSWSTFSATCSSSSRSCAR